MKYNLQYFAEGKDGDNTLSDNGNNDDISNGGNGSDSSDTGDRTEDITALAELISDKDKQIQQLEQDIADLRKSNANLLVKVNAMANPPEQKKSFEENLLSMVGAKPRKE